MKLTPQAVALLHALAIVAVCGAGVFAAHEGMPPAYVPIIVAAIAALGGGHMAHAIAGALTRSGVVPPALAPIVEALDEAPEAPAATPPKPAPPPLPPTP